MPNAKVPIKENIEIKHVRDGKVIAHHKISNLITTAGKATCTKRLGGLASTAAWSHIAIGTDATAAAIGQTALLAEITTGGGARAAATVTTVTTDTTDDTLKLEYTFTFSASFTVTETAVLNAASGGSMFNRGVVGPYYVVSTDQLTFVHTFDLD